MSSNAHLRASWEAARQPEFTHANCVASFQGEYLRAIEQAQGFPLTPRTARAPSSALRAFAALSKACGAALPGPEDVPCVPLGMVGPVLVVGHYHPGATHPFPREIVQFAVIPVEDYRAALDHFCSQIEYLRDVSEHLVPRAATPWSEAVKSDKIAERAALNWALHLGTVAGFDLGSVRTTLNDAVFNVARLSSDYQVGLQHIVHGTRVCRSDFAKPSLAAIPGLVQSQMERLQFVPYLLDAGMLFIWCVTPGERHMLDFISGKTQARVVPVQVSRESVVLLSQQANPSQKAALVQQSTEDVSAKDAIVIDAKDIERFDPRNAGENGNVLTLHWLLHEALKRGANDIHADVTASGTRVRMSIDNACVVVLQLLEARMQGLAAAVKTASSIKLDGKAHAEGRFAFMVGKRLVDVRVSLLHANTGPKLTLRLLDKSVGVKSTAQLGLSEEDLRTLRRAYNRREGILLVSGPTGHGKSTTLYAALNDLNTPERAIYTLEDPIEYSLDGVTQIFATSNAEKIAQGKMSFAEGIQRLLRADPDVILVGEIRDQSTARAAVEASMTGHLVLSTVHANDSASLVQRMLDLGADAIPFSDSLVMASSQRLVRRLCNCHSFRPITTEEKKVFECRQIKAPTYLHVKEGCSECDYTGYKGRVVVMEFLPITPDVRALVAQKASAAEIRRMAMPAGFRPMFIRGLDLVLNEITSLEEVERNCPPD